VERLIILARCNAPPAPAKRKLAGARVTDKHASPQKGGAQRHSFAAVRRPLAMAWGCRSGFAGK